MSIPAMPASTASKNTNQIDNRAQELSQLLSCAIDSFVNSISDGVPEKLSIKNDLQNTTLESLTKDLSTLQMRFSSKSRFKSLFDRLKTPLRQLDRFSKVIEIFIQSDPKISALIWGGLKLVIQLASEFNQFFDRVLAMIEKITQALPSYEAYHDLFGHDVRLRQTLVHVYIDILEFWGQVTNIFLRRDKTGSRVIRSNTSVVIRLCWNPVNSQLDEITNRFRDHTDELIQCADLAAMRGVSDSLERLTLEQSVERSLAARERSEAEVTREILGQLQESSRKTAMEENARRKEKTRRRLLKWLDPPSCRDTLDIIRAARHQDTGEWVLKTAEYQSWDSTPADKNNSSCVPQNRLLWIHGKPGIGKTFLVPIIVEELSSDSTATVVSYLCDYKVAENRSLRAILTSILFQLSRNKFDENLLNIFDLALAESETASAASEEELWSLLSVVLRHIKSAILVIDGLDECDLCDAAAYGFSKLSLDAYSVKIILLGRSNEESLQRYLSQHIMLGLNSTNVSQDIAAYISSRIDIILQLPFDHSVPIQLDRNYIISYLTRYSNGMFLWARLILDLLSCDALFPDQRTDILLKLHCLQGLDSLYTRILGLMSLKLQPHRELAQQVLLWVCYAQRTLKTEELEAALVITDQGCKRQVPPNIRNTILLACGGLVEITTKLEVQFIHLSVRDYLVQQSTGSGNSTSPELQQFCIPPNEAHVRLALKCLRYLVSYVPWEPLSGSINHKPELDLTEQRYPLVRYSSGFWIRHIERINSLPNSSDNRLMTLVTHLRKLLSSRAALLMWLESCFLFAHERELIRLCRIVDTVQAILRSLKLGHEAILAPMLQLDNEVSSIFSDFPHVIHESPNTIWSSLTDFLGSKSFLGNRNIELKHCSSDTPFQTAESQQMNEFALATTARLSADGQRFVVGSIWASKLFHDIKNDDEIDPDPEKVRSDRIIPGMAEKAASGWILAVQYWCTNTMEKLESQIQIQLNADEVLGHLQASCFRARRGRRTIDLPIVFSPDLSLVAAFSSVYRLQTGQDDGIYSPHHPVSRTFQMKPQYQPKKTTSKDVQLTLSKNNRYFACFVNNKFETSPAAAEIAVFDCLNLSHSYPLWQSDNIPAYTGDDVTPPQVALHPSLPLVAWSSFMSGTQICCFGANEEPQQLRSGSVTGLHFSSCGRFLCGFIVTTSLAIPLDLEKYQSLRCLSPYADQSDVRTSSFEVTTSTNWGMAPVVQGSLVAVQGRSLPRETLCPGGVIITNDEDGRKVISSLQTNPINGDLWFGRMKEGENIAERSSITRLPLLLSSQPSAVQASLGTDEHEKQVVTVALNCATRTSLNPPTEHQQPIIMRKPVNLLQPWEQQKQSPANFKRALEHSSSGADLQHERRIRRRIGM